VWIKTGDWVEARSPSHALVGRVVKPGVGERHVAVDVATVVQR
jgi:hypothetical protein